MSDIKILELWETNAAEWIKAIEEQTIESRKITSQAILNHKGNEPRGRGSIIQLISSHSECFSSHT